MNYKIKVPEDFYTIFKFVQENKVGVASINTALRNLNHKIVFSWHLSIMAKLNDTNNDGLPTNDENKRVEDFENKLNILLNPDVKKRNALFLGRIIWNDSVELIWRVHNAEEIYQIILDIIKQKKYVFSFDYRIDPDAEWKLAEWHLEDREYDIQIS